MSVRAKMKCEGVELRGDEEGVTVSLRPVSCGSEENEKFYKYTPGGQLLLSTINAAAMEQFEVGKEYFVDISPA